MLSIEHLTASVEKKRILDDISCSFESRKDIRHTRTERLRKIDAGEHHHGTPGLHAHPNASKLLWNGKSLKNLSPDKRALARSQHDLPESAGPFGNLRPRSPSLGARKEIRCLRTLPKNPDAAAKSLHIKDELLSRSLNDGFSGGEKKKLEALQIALIEPKLVLFDEIDTGVDVDALKTITLFLKRSLPKESTLVFITHSAKLLKYMRPDEVLVIKGGRLVASGGPALAAAIEKNGFSDL
jgi:Fe-S cluster assembly ATP-binding protein